VLPILNCAVRLQLDGHSDDARVKQAAIALGPVAPRPTRAWKAEDYLIGRSPTEETFAEAGRIARNEANPRTSVMRASREYRLDIIPILVSEALSEASWEIGRLGNR
jgi:carbon-monoxide dehydrogenase medium subunit